MSAALATRTFPITYTHTHLGAEMRPVDPKNPDAAFEPHTVLLGQDDDFPLCVGYAPECVREFDPGGHGDLVYDCKHEGPHGHIVIACDDGTAWVTLPTSSQAMINIILDAWEATAPRLFSIDDVREMRRILLIATKSLPAELTASDEKILAEMSGKSDAFRPFGWFS